MSYQEDNWLMYTTKLQKNSEMFARSTTCFGRHRVLVIRITRPVPQNEVRVDLKQGLDFGGVQCHTRAVSGVRARYARHLAYRIPGLLA